MDQIGSGLISGIIGGAIAAILVLLWVIIRPAKKCPDCGQTLPKFGTPKNLKRAINGGWFCPNCGIEIDRKGNKVSPKN